MAKKKGMIKSLILSLSFLRGEKEIELDKDRSPATGTLEKIIKKKGVVKS